ncbi:MAG: TIGR04255 family protein [Thermodesulfovibrionales bacterium]|nr:TIGR04255 family protein [Thermodesulfovibrionales bacterium]
MAEYPLLPNAPITEALIDIHIKVGADFDVARLLTLHDAISAQYPEKKIRHKLEIKSEFKRGQAPISASTETVDGYIFTSADRKQLFQAGIDRFTFNRLKPYDKWETFRDEAFRLWQLYKDLISPEIIRVALRFINKIDIPFFSQTALDFDDYLTAGPIVPKGLPQGISSFLTRMVIQEPGIDANAIITQAFEHIDPKVLPIILDIDVFKQKELIREEEAWQTLEALRNFKNKIFFASITEKTKELFQ